jgi:hypothetical protein
MAGVFRHILAEGTSRSANNVFIVGNGIYYSKCCWLREIYYNCMYRTNINVIIGVQIFLFIKYSLCTDVTLDEARERTFVSWMKIPCSGHVDFLQIGERPLIGKCFI